MRTAYLVRKNTWMSWEERLVARKIAREGENRLTAGLMAMDAVSAVVFYSAGCAAAVLGRVSERYVQMLAAGEDVTVMQEVFERAQGGVLMAARAMEVLMAARVGLAEERERNWFAETQASLHHRGIVPLAGLGSSGTKREEKEEGLLSMVGERLGSRIGAVGLAQGAMSGLALEEEAHRVGQALGQAREVPVDGEAELMAQMDVQFAAYQAKWEAGEAERERERGSASTTKGTKDAKAGGSGASGTSAFPNGNSGTRGPEEALGMGVVDGSEFSRLSRRERRFVERQARKEAKKGRKLAA